MNKFVKIDRLNAGDSLPVEFKEKLDLPQEYFVINNSTVVSFKGTMTLKSGLYNLSGVCSGEFSLLCGSCTDEVTYPYTIEVDEFFTNSLIDEEDSDIIYFKGFEVDVIPAIFTNIILNIPMNVLCSDECKGLCPYCGTNRNNSSCNCEKPIDPRFDLLNSFFDDKEEV